MFNRLRTRMLLMNLSIITVLMFIAFASIYLVTYNNMQTTISTDLMRVAEFRKTQQPPNDTLPPEDIQPPDDTHAPSDSNPVDTGMAITDSKTQVTAASNDSRSAFERSPDRTVSFAILVDENNEIISTNSFFDAEDDFYESALSAAESNRKDSGNFSLDGSSWAYLILNRDSGTIYTFMDITAQKSMLDRLIYTFIAVFVITFIFIYFISRFLTNRSIQPIKDAFEKQRQFISDASHELKTPLAVIRTNVDVLLQNKKDLQEEDQKWLGYIQSEVSRMSDLTKDLLYLTQMSDDESQQLMHAPFDVSDCIEKQMLGLEVVAFEKNIDLKYTLEPNVMLYGNAPQISQVVMILMDNAIKYTPERGRITLQLKHTAHHLQIDIANTGEGIAPEDLPHIFERFYRADKVRSRNAGSYGLGLSIAKAIVEQHNGKISCTSEPKGETRFTVRFKTHSIQ
jgi:signal transduction histidine kinase